MDKLFMAILSQYEAHEGILRCFGVILLTYRTQDEHECDVKIFSGTLEDPILLTD